MKTLKQFSGNLQPIIIFFIFDVNFFYMGHTHIEGGNIYPPIHPQPLPFTVVREIIFEPALAAASPTLLFKL